MARTTATCHHPDQRHDNMAFAVADSPRQKYDETVWEDRKQKHSKRRRPMMSGLVKYLATDSHMHAALLSPPSSRDLSMSRTVPFLDAGAKGGESGGNKRKRFFERAVEYLKSDTHLYGALVDVERSGSAAMAGPMRQIERVVVAVSRGMLFIEESRINGVPQDTNTKKSRFEENRLPVANVARTSQSISVQGDKVKNKVLRDFRSASVPGKKGVITRSRKVAGD